MANIVVDIVLEDDASPIYLKARSVPYALKKKVEDELERLVKLGLYEPIAYSPWATPIVPVPKSDGTIRICGDYKTTVNPRAKCEKYPVPKTEDLLATLNGGQRFTKLDLSMAYQQLRLTDSSAEILTLNTHKGLFRPKRLMFGVHSAGAIFQREIEKRLSGIPFTVVRVDDILISGRNDREHLDNVSQVLEVLHKNGLRLKESKCSFMKEEISYLGFKINKKGFH